MRKFLIVLAASITLAAPALAGTTMLSANLPHITSPKGASTASGVIVTVAPLLLIATGNRVDVYNPAANALIPSLAVKVTSLGTIANMAFTAPSFLTVQSLDSTFAVTIDYATSPPTVLPGVTL